jgi:hypothetical protein
MDQLFKFSVLQHHRKSLSEDDAQALLQNLIGWLIRCLESGEGGLVLRKLASTLVTYFLQFSASWEQCIAHLVYCLCLGRPVAYGDLATADTTTLSQSISNEKATIVLLFATILVEEVGKTDRNAMKQ